MSKLPSPEPSSSTIIKQLVRRIPPGRVASYGVIARAAAALGRPVGGARTVSWILAALKSRDNTPWHRVVGAGGVVLLPDQRGERQKTRLRREGVRFLKGVIPPAFVVGEIQLLSDPEGHVGLDRGRAREDIELLLAQKRIRLNPKRLRKQA